ncbi:hypothetical protein GCM10010987_35400 [Bradyrhizobium guangdongense]|uniref:Uncharacterized protein n=1 Tax=Bradyrhizobium guangdongense TaxID=1325090 RepID=A0AA88B9C4_9BRAD|nr:hypothetical protein GCM10010987_35400 [Bradyrhizobium guangdongense]
MSAAGSTASEDIELERRLFYLPTLHLDPWTKACVDGRAIYLDGLEAFKIRRAMPASRA